MRLHTLKKQSLGCYYCGHIWTWQNPPRKPKQCPNCLSRKWDKYDQKESDQYLVIAKHKFILTHKIKMGRRTKIRYSLEITAPKKEDWIQMFDLHYKCINCGEAWIGLTDEQDNKEYINIERERDSIECLKGV